MFRTIIAVCALAAVTNAVSLNTAVQTEDDEADFWSRMFDKCAASAGSNQAAMDTCCTKNGQWGLKDQCQQG